MSRCRTVTEAPSAISRWTSQVPRNPAPPVTSTELSFQEIPAATRGESIYGYRTSYPCRRSRRRELWNSPSARRTPFRAEIHRPPRRARAARAIPA